jgi:hydrophobic/amphiphilic exporter-1 (mainly G- bacteria), HAE1 family
LFVAGGIGTEFIPESDSSNITTTIELQTGTRFEESSVIARKVEDFVNENLPEVKLSAVTTGSDDRGTIQSIFQTSGSNIIVFTMNLSKPDESVPVRYGKSPRC